MNGMLGGFYGGSTTGTLATYPYQLLQQQIQNTFTITGGNVTSANAPPKPTGNLAWLDDRINEVRVRL